MHDMFDGISHPPKRIAPADATKTQQPDKGSADAMSMTQQYDELHKANVAKDTQIMTISAPLLTISGFKPGSAELPPGAREKIVATFKKKKGG